jgi:long-chain fatty acid transport protein
MLSIRIIIVAICVFLLSFSSQKAFAGDNGVIKLELPDAAAVGMGGAFTGEADRPSAVYYNPAGITQMDTIEASAGLTWLQPQVKFESATPDNGGTSEMKTQNFIFPDVFVTVPIIKNKLYLGIGESTDFGGGNSWEANGFSQYSTIKDSIEDKDYRLVAAYKINDQWSVGAGAVDDESAFEHDMAVSNMIPGSANADALFKATDNAWGFDLATMFKLNAQNQFGLDYKSPIHHTYEGNLYLSDLNPNSLGAPVAFGGFGGSTFSTKAVQKLTLPQSVTLGYDLKPTNKWTINFDLEWTDWSQYKQQITSYPNAGPFAAPLSAYGNEARDWTSVWSESVGVQYAVTDKFRVRAGYEHHQTPIPEATVDTQFPDSDSNSYTVGLGYDITKNLTIDIAYVADFYESRNVINSVDSGFGTNLSGKYSAFVNVGTMSLTYKF